MGHVILVGLPGAGKSTIGRAVAKRLDVPFLDFDLEIIHRTGQSIADLFRDRGEEGFRQLEVELTRELVGLSPRVLAPGGGWITSPGVVELLRPPGYMVHLRISPEAALRRLQRSPVVRPLLRQADPSIRIQALWEARRALYARADAEVSAESVGVKRVAETVIALARGRSAALG